MKKKLLNLTPQAINAIFSYLSQDDRIVTWVADHNFSSQVYLSDSFTTLFGWPKESMYQNLSLWNQFLIPEDKGRTESELIETYSNDTPFKLMQYRCYSPQGKVLYVEDHHFPIVDSTGTLIAHGGYTSFLTPEEWYVKRKNLRNNDDQTKGLSFYETIMHELDVKCSLKSNHQSIIQSKTQYSIVINKKRILITPREAETLYLLLKGYPTKLIARTLKISPRTTELHIVHIREKTCTRSRLDLLRQIQNIDEIHTWIF